MAKANPKTTKAKKPAIPTTEDGNYAVYDPSAARDSYSKGDIVFFHKVRNWLDKGALVEAYGKVVSVSLFDNEVPYLEVSFDDSQTRKLNKVDLGKDIRKFLLEVK